MPRNYPPGYSPDDASKGGLHARPNEPNLPFRVAADETMQGNRKARFEVEKNLPPGLDVIPNMRGSTKTSDGYRAQIEKGERIANENYREMARDVSKHFRAYQAAFAKSGGSSSIAYIGSDRQRKADSMARASTITAEIKTHLSESDIHGASRHSRRSHAEARLPGNSYLQSLGLKDRVNAQGHPAVVVRLATHGSKLAKDHYVTAVAPTVDDLESVRKGNVYGAGAASRVMILDATLGISCHFSGYAKAAKEAAKQLDRDGMGIFDQSSEKYVSPVKSGWADALGSFPRRIEFCNIDRLPKHDLAVLKQTTQIHESRSVAHEAVEPAHMRTPSNRPPEMVR